MRDELDFAMNPYRRPSHVTAITFLALWLTLT
jgi:hypothetical protein